MASASDIAQVRLNTNEPDDVDPFTDALVGGLIDTLGVTGATASIWEAKAATIAATAVDITEADATHKMSDRFDHASAMVKYWADKKTTAEQEVTTSRVRVRVIERSS